MTTVFIVAIALLLDAALGEPHRLHPLVGFGRLAEFAERQWYGSRASTPREQRARGAAALLILITPFVLIATLTRLTPIGIALDAIILYFAIGWNSLGTHARRIYKALQANELTQAREGAGMIVSRDTAPMGPSDISKATVESVLENGNDAIFGALFWFVLAGAPGAMAYRLVNTLDAMWGYRTQHYVYFGWAAARLDDVLNFVPARLTAFSYAIVGQTRAGLRCWRRQGRRWKSPNAGPVMAAGAGSLGVTLGGAAQYQGVLQMRPALGEGRDAEANDIERSLRLVQRSVLLWVLLLAGGQLAVESIFTR